MSGLSQGPSGEKGEVPSNQRRIHIGDKNSGGLKDSERLFWGATKSLQMMTVAMKLKDACSLEEKLRLT